MATCLTCGKARRRISTRSCAACLPRIGVGRFTQTRRCGEVSALRHTRSQGAHGRTNGKLEHVIFAFFCYDNQNFLMLNLVCWQLHYHGRRQLQQGYTCCLAAVYPARQWQRYAHASEWHYASVKMDFGGRLGFGSCAHSLRQSYVYTGIGGWGGGH